MLTLGIDPGSVKTGWALLKHDRKTHDKKTQSRRIHVVASGVLEFDSKAAFLDRLAQIKAKSGALLDELSPDAVALESLIYVKSPQSLIKLAQTRGMILSAFIDTHKGRIFEYSPNLVKSSAVGHGHADKESVRKFLDMTLGKREYKTDDESDAVAVALCHIMNQGRSLKKSAPSSGGSGLARALAHKTGK